MKILVTGGAGFIGKHLVKSLLGKKQQVTIFDNFSNSTKDSIFSLVELGAKIIEGDITKLQEIIDAVKENDIVIHLAAKISVPESIKNPTETFQVNVNGTRNVLCACKKNNIKKLIVASSAAIYGESLYNTKITEESRTNPISPYGESKLRMEKDVQEFGLENNIDCIILRFFNIYGVDQTSEYAGVITKFIEKIRQDEDLEIFGDGLQTRDFVAIDDVINSFHNAIHSGKNGTYNIASGESTTIIDLAKKMILLSGKKLEIKFAPPKRGEIKHSLADITLAKQKIGYFPMSKLNKIKELLK